MAPTLLAAVASGALLAVAGNRPWLSVDGAPEPSEGAGQTLVSGLDLAVRSPTVTALSLVALAALGVVLVTRGRVRRAVAVLALVAAAGTAAAVVTTWVTGPGRVADETAGGPLADAGTSWTWWAWAALPAAALLLAACAWTVRDVGRWPEMGRRYDAPTGAAAGGSGAGTTGPGVAPQPDPADRSSLDLWRALDEGRDPTDDGRH